MDQYNWLPTECAPRHYPVQLLSGDLIFENGDSIYIPDKRLVCNGWGETGSIHLVGEESKPLPSRLSIAWFSFTENKFYSANLGLPLARLAALFDEGYTSSFTGTKTTYSYILVGLAPGGGIAVWVKGEQVTREVCFLQARETVAEETDFNFAGMTRSQFIQSNLKQVFSPEDFHYLEKNKPCGELWKTTYRERYKWKLLVVSAAQADKVWIRFCNGEREYIEYNMEDADKTGTRGIPQTLTVCWTDTQQEKYSSDISFHEQETCQAFSKLWHAEGEQEIKLQLVISNTGQPLEVFLSNEKYMLRLKQCTIQV